MCGITLMFPFFFMSTRIKNGCSAWNCVTVYAGSTVPTQKKPVQSSITFIQAKPQTMPNGFDQHYCRWVGGSHVRQGKGGEKGRNTYCISSR